MEKPQKKNRIRFTKTQIMEAIAEAGHFRFGNWLENTNGEVYNRFSGRQISEIMQLNGNCQACAVGTIVKHKIQNMKTPEKFEGWNFFDACRGDYSGSNSSKKLLAEKNYLGALSAYFEGPLDQEMCDVMAISPVVRTSEKHHSRIRRKLRAFVKKNFPETFYVEV